MRLISSLDFLETQSHVPEVNPNERQVEGLPDSPESPDESLCSVVFVVEKPSNHGESLTMSKVAEYLERVQQEDSSTIFITPPGTPKKINFPPVSPLNDLEEERDSSGAAHIKKELSKLTFLLRQPGRGVQPTRVALSQPAPGLGCSCRRIAVGRGHGCSLRFPRW